MFMLDNEKFEALRLGYKLKDINWIKSNLGLDSNPHLNTIVDYVIDEIYKHVTGKFKVDFKDYLMFYGANYLREIQFGNELVSLDKYYQNLSNERKWELNIHTKKTLERRWNEFNKHNVIYIKNHNFTKNDIRNRKGHDLSITQINELEFLLENFDNPIIKKFRNGKFKKIKYADFEKFSSMVTNFVEKQCEGSPIEYYKYERRIHFELIKYIAKKTVESNYDIKNDSDSCFMIYMNLLFRIPDIKNVYVYFDLFLKTNVYSRSELLKELISLNERMYPLLIGYLFYIIEGLDKQVCIKMYEAYKQENLQVYCRKNYSVENLKNESEIEIFNFILSKL